MSKEPGLNIKSFKQAHFVVIFMMNNEGEISMPMAPEGKSFPKVPASTSCALAHPEAELLLCCARTRIDAATAERVRTIICKSIDWTRVLRLAANHSILPLLYKNLHAICGESVPEAILNKLQNHFFANASRNRLLTAELLKTLSFLNAQGILALPFKGPVLAAAVYGNLSLRQFTDLDILVRKRDVLNAKNVLVSQGYTVYPDLDGEGEAEYLNSHYVYQFLHTSGKIQLELHWEIARKYFTSPIHLEGLWERLECISLAGKPVLNLPINDLLLILCVHGSKHCWNQLSWICDIAELVRVHQEMDWEMLIRQANALGSKRMLLLGLALANRLLEAPLPKAVLDKISDDPSVELLTGQVSNYILREDKDALEVYEKPLSVEGFSMNEIYFHLKSRERLKDRALYCFRLARRTMTPTEEDRMVISLPARLFFFYYLLRPVRLIRVFGLKPFATLMKSLMGL